MAQRDNPNELRDHLANERTFLSWMRTAITIIALGFVVAKFGILLREVGGGRIHSETARVGGIVGVGLVFGGMITALLGGMKFLQIRRDIENRVVNFSVTLDVALAVVLCTASVVLAVYLIATA